MELNEENINLVIDNSKNNNQDNENNEYNEDCKSLDSVKSLFSSPIVLLEKIHDNMSNSVRASPTFFTQSTRPSSSVFSQKQISELEEKLREYEEKNASLLQRNKALLIENDELTKEYNDINYKRDELYEHIQRNEAEIANRVALEDELKRELYLREQQHLE
jgi:hypothetical protein